MLPFLIVLLCQLGWIHQAEGCVDFDPNVGKCNVLRDLLFTSFSYIGGGPHSRVFASTFYLDGERAEIACKRRSMQLVEIASKQMFNSIVSSLEDINAYDKQAFHIAGRYKNGGYHLENGRQLPNNLPWHYGEPSRTDGRNKEDCLVLERRNGRFKLNDVRCWEVNFRYLCQGNVMGTSV